jgi:hypothetical protein
LLGPVWTDGARHAVRAFDYGGGVFDLSLDVALLEGHAVLAQADSQSREDRTPRRAIDGDLIRSMVSARIVVPDRASVEGEQGQRRHQRNHQELAPDAGLELILVRPVESSLTSAPRPKKKASEPERR